MKQTCNALPLICFMLFWSDEFASIIQTFSCLGRCALASRLFKRMKKMVGNVQMRMRRVSNRLHYFCSPSVNEAYRPSSFLHYKCCTGNTIPSSIPLVLTLPLRLCPTSSSFRPSLLLLQLFVIKAQVPTTNAEPYQCAATSVLLAYHLLIRFHLMQGTVFPHGRWQGIKVPIGNTTVPLSMAVCGQRSNTLLFTRCTRSNRLSSNVRHERP